MTSRTGQTGNRISDKKSVQDLLAILEAKQIRHVIITPGSRNAPFSISLFQHPSFKVFNITDERSAAFFALGIAQQTQRPVVLICTSGTAALNYAPAIAEAFYQQIPLLVITADRPIEWVDQGDGQTIRQSRIFSNFVKAGFDMIQEATDNDAVWHNQRLINEAVNLCIAPAPGPVHINFPLRESLYQTTDTGIELPKLITIVRHEKILPESEWEDILQTIGRAKKIVILCGQLSPDKKLLDALLRLSKDQRINVLTESHSNLANADFIGTIDRFVNGMNDDEKKYFVPDILITIGRNVISKIIKSILRKGKFQHWHIDESGECLDTFQHLTQMIPLSPVAFMTEWSNRHTEKEGEYAAVLRARHVHNRNTADDFLQQAPFSDLTAMSAIIRALPAGSHLQMGNSAVVRYAQLMDPRPDMVYFANRGVSGIDGCTSTAVGAAYVTNVPTTLITGDIAFFYDSNAFWNHYISDRLKIIIVNNQGGGIFRIIEGPGNTPALEDFFEAHHQRTAQELAALYHLDYYAAQDMASLTTGLSKLFSTLRCAVLEVHTPRLENDQVLKDYFNYIKKH